MAGIYIHIPFCRRACHYCNFHFSTSLKLKDQLIHSLLLELELRKNYLGNEKINTIYFGGGTPSILSEAELNSIFEKLYSLFNVSADAEMTLEANPDDLNNEKLTQLQCSPINRLSIGLQSFREEDLRWMNRSHTAAQAEAAVKTAQNKGFHNISADLIYGIPGLSDEYWHRNVQRVINFNIPHLSCYALTVEPRTALENFIKKDKSPDVNPEQQARQFLLLMDWLKVAGYEHYEISNFSLPGQYSRHNSNYWNGIPYLGIGPSAHSFNGNSRQWNIANNAQYIASINKGIIPFEKEILTDEQQLNEYIMTSLRTKDGIDINKISHCWGENEAQRLLKEAQHYINDQKIIFQDQRLILTNKGKLFADGIAADLFKEPLRNN